MLSLLSIFLTCLALILIPCLFIFRRPSVPLFLKKTHHIHHNRNFSIQ
uniref:Uncharacterized protein n=1 Tax=Brassica campestris TaxID=3711 RepID=A0A3P5ZVD3_BRACM|nr:unnamed protein product [Brassica rapa]